jgi:hypothetical protein
MTREEVRAYLEENKHNAVRLKQKTYGGQFLWKIGDLRVVTKRDDHVDVAVTILPEEHDHRRYTEDDLERIREYQERIAEQEALAKNELAVAEEASVEVKKRYLRDKASDAPTRSETHDLMLHAQTLAVQTRKSVAAALEMMKLERANLKDWEKTVRHAMRTEEQDTFFKKMLAFLKDLDNPEARKLFLEVTRQLGMPVDQAESDTAPSESRPLVSALA